MSAKSYKNVVLTIQAVYAINNVAQYVIINEARRLLRRHSDGTLDDFDQHLFYQIPIEQWQEIAQMTEGATII